MKLTAWYPMEVLPVRVGVYEMNPRDLDIFVYCKYSGAQWLAANTTVEKAAVENQRSGGCYSGHILNWRGILK